MNQLTVLRWLILGDTPPTPLTTLLENGHRIALKSAISAVKRSRKQSESNIDDVAWFRAHCYSIQILGSLCNNAELQQVKREMELLKSVINR